MTAELRRALARLEPNDPARPLIELVIEEDDPALTGAVVRRLLAEIRAEKGGSRTETAAAPETTRVAGQDLRE